MQKSQVIYLKSTYCRELENALIEDFYLDGLEFKLF